MPFPSGGQTDIVARMLAQKLTETFKQTVVVDNRPGGGGTIGTEIAVRTNPDGYSMIMVSASYATNASLYKLSYDPLNDDQMAGTKMTHVPYKGTGLGLNDLLGGQIQVIFGGFNQMFPQIKSNRVRGIAVTNAKRSNAVPDIPTVGETVPGYEAVQWFAIWGPKAFPKDLVARWNREINRILQLSDVKKLMAGDGVEPAGGSPERFREVLTRDVAKWQKVVRIAGIKTGS